MAVETRLVSAAIYTFMWLARAAYPSRPCAHAFLAERLLEGAPGMRGRRARWLLDVLWRRMTSRIPLRLRHAVRAIQTPAENCTKLSSLKFCNHERAEVLHNMQLFSRRRRPTPALPFCNIENPLFAARQDCPKPSFSRQARRCCSRKQKCLRRTRRRHRISRNILALLLTFWRYREWIRNATLRGRRPLTGGCFRFELVLLLLALLWKGDCGERSAKPLVESDWVSFVHARRTRRPHHGARKSALCRLGR
jgi:hypothetical protein